MASGAAVRGRLKGLRGDKRGLASWREAGDKALTDLADRRDNLTPVRRGVNTGERCGAVVVVENAAGGAD